MFSSNAKLDKSIPIPLYYQVKGILLNEIKSGNVAVGEPIPTESQLCKMYQISRSTVRQAISELVQEGWLVRKTSKGTFVTNPEQTASHIRSFEPFYQQISKRGKKPRTELVELKIIDATTDLAGNLGIAPGDRVISMFRRRFADEEPLVTIQNFLPYSTCDFILSHDFKAESLYEVLMQNQNARIHSTKTIVSAAKATAEDAKYLNVKHGSPMLCFHAISKTEDGKIIDYAFSHYRGDLNRFEIDASPEK
ncbi:MAG: GntR family transcriptional regulator [Oscillospiraceae bacterium]